MKRASSTYRSELSPLARACGAAVPFVAALAVASAPSVAHADTTIIKQPGEHPDYHVDIEPHGILGWGFYGWGPVGLGGGVRFSIPLCKNCFIPKINNNV